MNQELMHAQKWTITTGSIFFVGLFIALAWLFPTWYVFVAFLLTFIIGFVSVYPKVGLLLMAATFGFIEAHVYLDGVFTLPYVDAFALLTLVGFLISRLWQACFYQKEIQKDEFVLFLPFALFTLAYGISVTQAEALLSSMKFVLRPIAFFYVVFVLLPYNLISDQEEMKDVFWMMALSGVISALMGFASLFVFEQSHVPRITPVGVFDIWPFGLNQNVLAQSLVVSIPATLTLAYLMTNKRLTQWLVLASAFQVLIALGTLSRAAWIALFVQALIIVLVQYKNHIKELIKSSWMILVLALPLMVLMGQLLTSDISASANQNRLMLSDIAYNALRESPLIGYGAGSFTQLVAQDRWYLLWFGHPIDSHGVIQKVAAEAGLLGLITFGYLVYAIGKRLIGTYTSAPNQTTKHVALGFLVMVSGIFVFQLFNTSYFTSVLWLPVGLALASTKLIYQKV